MSSVQQAARQSLVILTSQQVIQLDAAQYKHVKLQEKVSLPGAQILKVTSETILCSDPL